MMIADSDGTPVHFVAAWGKAWGKFREEGVADVKAALQWCQQRAETCEEREEMLRDTHAREDAREYARKAQIMRRRATGLSMLLDYMVQHGPEEVPSFQDYISEQSEEDQFKQLPTREAKRYGKTFEVQMRRFKIRKRVDLSENVPADRKEELADERSIHTIEKDLKALREEFVN